PVLDDERLPKPLRQPLADQAREDVCATAGSEAYDNAHWMRWIGCRFRGARQCWDDCCCRCQAQKLAARKAHLRPPLSHRPARRTFGRKCLRARLCKIDGAIISA